MASPLWIPGKSQYAEWLKTLTKEEYEAHLRERREKKSMKQTWKEVVEAQKEEWNARINSAMVAVLNKAIEQGDAQALATVFDRVIGKPQDAVDVTSNGKTMQAPTIVFQTGELAEWNTKDDDHSK